MKFLKSYCLFWVSIVVCACHSTPKKATESKPDFSIKLIRQNSDTILVRYLSDTDSSSIFISGIFQDEVINCDSCLLVLSDANKKVVPYYKVNDSLVLIPVLGVNWKILLYGIDFKKEKQLIIKTTGEGNLETYLEMFLYDSTHQEVITSGAILYDENTDRSGDINLYHYKISSGWFDLKQTEKVKMKEDIFQQAEALRKKKH